MRAAHDTQNSRNSKAERVEWAGVKSLSVNHMIRPFHLALPTSNLAATRRFYVDVMGCRIGREDTSWVDLDLYGHQLVFHDCGGKSLPTLYNPVDRHQVPLPHFGIILRPADFTTLAARLEGQVSFVIAPTIRFSGTPGEQQTMFFKDPNAYALEFKAFADDRFIFEPFEPTG